MTEDPFVFHPFVYCHFVDVIQTFFCLSKLFTSCALVSSAHSDLYLTIFFVYAAIFSSLTENPHWRRRRHLHAGNAERGGVLTTKQTLLLSQATNTKGDILIKAAAIPHHTMHRTTRCTTLCGLALPVPSATYAKPSSISRAHWESRKCFIERLFDLQWVFELTHQCNVTKMNFLISTNKLVMWFLVSNSLIVWVTSVFTLLNNFVWVLFFRIRTLNDCRRRIAVNDSNHLSATQDNKININIS